MPQDTSWSTQYRSDAAAAAAASPTSQRSSSGSFLLEEDTFCDALELDGGGGNLQDMRRALTARDVITRLHHRRSPRHNARAKSSSPLLVRHEAVPSDARRGDVEPSYDANEMSGLLRERRQIARGATAARPAARFVVEYTEAEARVCLSLLETEARRALFKASRALCDLQRTHDATRWLHGLPPALSTCVVHHLVQDSAHATRFADHVLAQAPVRHDRCTTRMQPLSLLERTPDAASSVAHDAPRSLMHSPAPPPPQAMRPAQSFAASTSRTRSSRDASAEQIRGTNESMARDEHQLAHKQYERFFRAFYDDDDGSVEGGNEERRRYTADVLQATRKGLLPNGLSPSYTSQVRRVDSADCHSPRQERVRQPRVAHDDDGEYTAAALTGYARSLHRRAAPRVDETWRRRTSRMHSSSHAHEITSDADISAATPQQELDAAEAQVSISL